MSITKINPYVAPLMCVAATVLSASLTVADNPVTLENDFVEVTLDGQGLRKIHDKKTDRTVELASDQFSLAVNGDVIESTSITPTVKEGMSRMPPACPGEPQAFHYRESQFQITPLSPAAASPSPEKAGAGAVSACSGKREPPPGKPGASETTPFHF